MASIEGGASDCKMHLTLELAGKAPGPGICDGAPAGRRPSSEDDYRAMTADILSSAPSRDEFWVFAYGSLIWNPAFDHDMHEVGVVRGWRRSFCLGWDRWFRGCIERPGLMMALDRGGQCTGIAYRLPQDALEENILRLVKREVRFLPHAFPPRHVTVHTPARKICALTFAMDRKSGSYVTGLTQEQIADVLAHAAGSMGTMAEYLHNTVLHLEQHGIRDHQLWALQQMVADRLRRL
jgi:cation transport protein ChaC